MELWIRNQDRENLVKVELLEINEREKDCTIITMFQNQVAHLGIYKTKERALEVLDEIQKLLQPIYKVTSEFKKSEITGNCQWTENQEYIPIQTKVYEMPKE